MELDLKIFNSIHSFVGTSGILDFFGSFFAQAFPLLILATFLVFLILEPDWKVRFRKFAFVVLSVILSRWLITETLQFFFPRTRPPIALNFEPLIDMPPSPSFPSGHAAIFFALGMAVFFLNKKWGSIFLIGACLIGVARIFAGVHYPFDVLAGALAGILSAVAVFFLFKKV